MEKKTYSLSISYGKDSLACLGAIEKLGWKLDKIVHAEIWATDDIQADLPSMVEFKAKADKIILERWGIVDDHVWAMDGTKKVTYENEFYKEKSKGDHIGDIYGFPLMRGSWCVSQLKTRAIRRALPKNLSGIVQYIGIAKDEPERLSRLDGITKISPLEAIGWTEADCMKWCKENDLLSPIYTDSTRGGCWFCHKQGIDQLRHLRKNYPQLWKLMLKWDEDSPIHFRTDGKTIHDFDRRFNLEEQDLVRKDSKFKWKDIDNVQLKLW